MRNSTRHFARNSSLYIAAAAIGLLAFVPSDGAPSRPRDKVIIAGGERIVIPAASPMQHWRALSEPGSYGATFRGKFLLTGTLYYFGKASDAKGDPGGFLFSPDKASAARLPYMKDDGKPRRNYLVGWSDLEADFLPAGLRKAADKSKGLRNVAGSVSLHFDTFTTIVDGCGVNEYSIDGATVDHVGPLHLVPSVDYDIDDC